MIGSIHLPWYFGRDTESQAQFQTNESVSVGMGPRNLYFKKLFKLFFRVLKFEKHSSIVHVGTFPWELEPYSWERNGSLPWAPSECCQLPRVQVH